VIHTLSVVITKVNKVKITKVAGFNLPFHQPADKARPSQGRNPLSSSLFAREMSGQGCRVAPVMEGTEQRGRDRIALAVTMLVTLPPEPAAGKFDLAIIGCSMEGVGDFLAGFVTATHLSNLILREATFCGEVTISVTAEVVRIT
jgi:hypothetical protein